MIRTFRHFFDPALSNPIKGKTVDLTVDEIEDAGIREVLQTPGAALGTWAIFDGLLEPSGDGSPFVFKEPLGQAREVKVALSGLFGRFVARAYLKRYLGLSIFAHLGQREILLDGKLRVRVRRKSKGGKGDLPDWVACDAALGKLTVAEAKGCNDESGPQQALERGWKQANRVDILVKSRKAPLKRVAIATRWGVANGGADTPIISVRDPEEEGNMSDAEREATAVGVARLHAANLLKALGYAELASALNQLVRAREDEATNAGAAAQQVLNGTHLYQISGDQPVAPSDGLVGNWVTRAGPVPRPELLTPADQRSLQRLEFRPVFVGLERRFVAALIAGNPTAIRQTASRARHPAGTVRTDGAGGWIVRVDDNTVLE